ncbi:aldo/keto reductase [Sulfodiicoccus acidiphilus]|uniref:Aldo/keto reductase n=2 Tax=Sulfodiicoccus acidiphilus TaxID=1670455 RepID=A0A348B537_9CREN|nr:aldo/keto reductase [Sulfodiicoccus acidiphilus]GGT89345.1 aldo/keto reductase [Sulfodiicoccus acidiphilus]
MDTMEYRFLGKSGLKVSELALGTMTFGREASKEESFKMLDLYASEGGNFIDTANVYSNGKSEEIVGEWLRGKDREDFVVATKVRFPVGQGPNRAGLSRKHILWSVEQSLRRLNTDYLDLYQFHAWDDFTPLEESLSTMTELVEAGKVRYVGVSNFTGWQLQRAVDVTKELGLQPIVSIQPLYNLLDRYLELEVLPVAQREGVGVIPWSPLRGGWLTGKYRRGMQAPPEDTRIGIAEKFGWSESWSRYNNERTWKVVDRLLEVSKEVGREPSQVALRWLLQRAGVTAPIVGARNVQQLKVNLGAAGWVLESKYVDLLTEVSEPELFYPYDFVRNAQRRR